MPRLVRAVVNFTGHPNGPLPTAIVDGDGWGTHNPVTLTASTDPWPSMNVGDGIPWQRMPGRVTNGMLTAPLSPWIDDMNTLPAQVATAQYLLDSPTPDAGRIEIELGVDPSFDPSTVANTGAGLHFFQVAGCGLTSIDNQQGVLVAWSSLLGQVLLYTWDLTSGSLVNESQIATDQSEVLQSPAGQRLSVTWGQAGATPGAATGFTARTNQTVFGRPMPTPNDFTDWRPFVLAAKRGPHPDYVGIGWAALTETSTLPPAPGTATAGNVGPGPRLVAATKTNKIVAEIPADEYTTTLRLTEPSSVDYGMAYPDGPKLVQMATQAQVWWDGRRILAGLVGPRNRGHNEDGALPRKWSTKDRRGQLDFRCAYPTHRLEFDQVPLREVVESLIGDTMLLDGGDIGIRVDPDMAAGPTISLTVTPFETISAAVGRAFTAAGGDWDIDRHDLIVWWPDGRGIERPFPLDHGGTVAIWDENTPVDQYGTALWITGANGATPVYRQVPGIADTAGGRIDCVMSDPDERHPISTSGRADRLIGDVSKPRSSYTATLNLGAWHPSKLEVGDYAPCWDPTLGLDDVLRVQEISFTVTGNAPSDADPVVRVTVGAPPTNFVRRVVQQGRAIQALQRR